MQGHRSAMTLLNQWQDRKGRFCKPDVGYDFPRSAPSSGRDLSKLGSEGFEPSPSRPTAVATLLLQSRTALQSAQLSWSRPTHPVGPGSGSEHYAEAYPSASSPMHCSTPRDSFSS